MTRRIFVVLWLCWLFLIALPAGAAGVYERFTEGFSIRQLGETAALIWIPFFVLLALQYIIVGHANLLRLWFNDPE